MSLRVTVVAVAAFLSIGVGVASASVSHSSGPFSKTFTVTGLCSFPVSFHVEGVNQETDFTDEQGRLIETIQTGAITETFSGNGNTLTTHAAGPLIADFDPTTGEITSVQIAGVGFQVTLPGEGVVLLSAGLTRITDTSFVVEGPFKQTPAFCAALA